jgi:hypothetical protein
MNDIAQTSSDPDSPRSRPFSSRSLLRLLVAIAGSALIDLVIWATRPTHLSGHIDIVGNPTFTNYNYLPVFLGYRLVTYAFPVGVIVIYLLLEWRGPLRGPKRGPRRGAVPLVVPPAGPAAAMRPWYRVAAAPWLALIPPAIVIALAIRPGAVVSPGEVTRLRIACVLAYVLAVPIVAGVAFIAAERYPRRRVWPFSDCLFVANAAGGALAALAGLWFVSHNTVAVLLDGATHSWPWLPWWVAALGVIAAWTWLAYRLRGGWAPGAVEQRLRAVLLGSAAMYLIVAVIPGAIASFQGFDDAQNLTGAALFQRGYFPWRDFQFIHGFFLDILQSLIGFHIFASTEWGSLAGIALVLVPLSWVAMYLLGVWAAPRGSLIILGTLALAAWGGVTLDPRFITVPLVLILLGKAIASRRLIWTSALTLALFIEGIAMPETDYQVIAAFLVVLGADLVHRRPGQGVPAILRRTLCFVGTGAILTAAWAVFLASQHALKGFFDWYVVFVPGHNAEADIHPVAVNTIDYVMFGIMICLSVFTFLSAAWRMRYRHAWTPRAWVTLAAALNAAVYGEQAIARLDGPHVQLSINVGLPLMVLCVAAAVPAAEDFLMARLGRVWQLPGRVAWRPQPVAVMALVAVIVLAPTIRSNIWHAPHRTRVVIGPVQPGSPLGYATPQALAPGVLADLRTVLDTYASKDAPFFDMTNSPGYFYYLLGRRPGTVFTNLALAIPESAQRLLVDDLRRSRPPLITFNSATFGQPAWDYIQNEVRDFLVSQYVLDGWTPIVSTQGVLFLLRNDLVASRPPLPKLMQPPITTDLYNSQGICNWGDSANFLTSTPVGSAVTLRAQHPQRVRQIMIAGWAVDSGAGTPAKEILIATGDRSIATVRLGVSRPDVAAALHVPAAVDSGFNATVATSASGPVRVYALGSDDALHLLPGTGNQGGQPVASIHGPHGSVLRVGAPGVGNLDSVDLARDTRVTTFKVPDFVSLPSYQLATFGADGQIGNSRLTLSNVNALSANMPAGAAITAGTLPVTGSRLAVRVGSCLQWHAYHGRILYLSQRGGAPITSLTLSNVKQ